MKLELNVLRCTIVRHEKDRIFFDLGAVGKAMHRSWHWWNSSDFKIETPRGNGVFLARFLGWEGNIEILGPDENLVLKPDEEDPEFLTDLADSYDQ